MPHTAPRGNDDRVLVTGDGAIVPGPAATFPAATIPATTLASAGGSGGTTATTTTATGAVASPFVINITYDASVAAAPAGFTAGVAAAVQYLESQFTDPVTINIAVGYGEVAGYTLGQGALGESLTYLNSYSYAAIAGALSADATTPTDAAAVASLPSASPVAGATYWTSTAEAKALGLAGPSTAIDGYIGFSSQYPFDYNPADGITAGAYDFNGTVLHEITEVMGRMMLTGGTIGNTPNGYYPLDLLHYAAPGVRDFSATTPGYFSVDGGTTSLGGFNTDPNGDAADWGTGMGSDSFNAFSYSGVINAVSPADLTTLDAIGWDAAGGATATVLAPPAPQAAAPSPPAGPTGISLLPAIYSAGTVTSRGLSAGASIATVQQVGGPSADAYSYALTGAGAGRFTLGSDGSLAVGASGVTGAVNGATTLLGITATDTNQGTTSPSSPVAIIVGASAADTVNIGALAGATDTPAFIYGLAGNDQLSGTGMTSALWFAGGAGADRMTGGSGPNTYLYGATSDSTARAMDIITNFNAATDLIDLTGLENALQVVGQFSSGKLAAGSIGWQVSGGNTFVYVNMSGRTEKITGTDMKIELQGNVALSGANFQHA